MSDLGNGGRYGALMAKERGGLDKGEVGEYRVGK